MVWHTPGLEYYRYSSLVKNKQSLNPRCRKKETNEFSCDSAASTLLQHQRPITLTCVHQHRYCVPPGCHLRWATFDSEEHMQLCPSTEWSSVSWLWRTHGCQIRPTFSRLQNLEELLRTSFSQQQPESGHCSVPFTFKQAVTLHLWHYLKSEISKEPRIRELRQAGQGSRKKQINIWTGNTGIAEKTSHKRYFCLCTWIIWLLVRYFSIRQHWGRASVTYVAVHHQEVQSSF